ncbi:hypothetical protein AB0M95_29290 [Sphaerisporangium sp. NPDC051017]
MDENLDETVDVKADVKVGTRHPYQIGTAPMPAIREADGSSAVYVAVIG